MALTSIFHSLVLLGVFPYDMVWGGRLETHAEAGDGYRIRLGNQKERFKYMNINYYQSPLIPWADRENEKIIQKKETK